MANKPENKLVLAPTPEAETYLQEGKTWSSTTKAPFSDVRRVGALAIAEYLANKDGYTLYESVADIWTPK